MKKTIIKGTTLITMVLIGNSFISNTFADDNLLDDLLNDTGTINTDNTGINTNKEKNEDLNINNLLNEDVNTNKNNNDKKSEIKIIGNKINFIAEAWNKDYILEIKSNVSDKLKKKMIEITDKNGNKINYILETDTNIIKNGNELNKGSTYYIELDGNYDKINVKLNNFEAKKIMLKSNSDVLGTNLKIVYNFDNIKEEKQVEKKILTNKKTGIEENYMIIMLILGMLFYLIKQRKTI